jgi:hypothetical protein
VPDTLMGAQVKCPKCSAIFTAQEPKPATLTVAMPAPAATQLAVTERRVFISHSTKDRTFVEKHIIELLKSHGVDTWYSKDDIHTGERWERTIKHGLESCDWFVVVMSRASADSEWVKIELDWAMAERLQRIVPVLIDDCNPRQLHLGLPRIQHVDFHGDLEEGQRKLLALFGIASARSYRQGATIEETRRQHAEEDRQKREQAQQSTPSGQPLRLNILRSVDRNPVRVPAEGATLYGLIKLLPTGDLLQRIRRGYVLVLNVSGAMYRQDGTGRSRLRRVQDAAIAMLSQLSPGDQVAVVAYAFAAEVVLPPTPLAGAKERARVEAAIRTVETCAVDRGGNDLAQGIELGLQLAEKLAGQGCLTSLSILLTDEEMTDEEQCYELARHAARQHIPFTLFGLGVDWNASLAKQLAHLSGGTWHYIDASDAGSAQAVVLDIVESFDGNPFDAACLHLRGKEGIAVTRVWHLGDETRAVKLTEAEPRHWTAELGTLESEKPQRYLIQIRITARPDGKYTVLDVEATYGMGRQDTTGCWPLEIVCNSSRDGRRSNEILRCIQQVEVLQANESPEPSVAPHEHRRCPECGSVLNEGAVACMDCGFMPSTAELGSPPIICSNPACGVGNPVGERFCQRCSTPLPLARGALLHFRYRLVKLLKMGGFGAVYLAVDTKQDNRLVAIKDMLCNDPQEFAIRLNFFRREAEILRLLKDVPSVPRIYDFIQEGSAAHLIMEFIPGKDLLDILEANNHRPFPLEQVIEWGQSACDLLHTLHTQPVPIMLRSMKPDDILLLEDGRSIKFVDFGCARDIGRTPKEMNASTTRVYTEGYAPPEQIIGKTRLRSDLFSLAATLYHLATGKMPEGMFTGEALHRQMPAQDRWFYELIRINLSEDIHDRYFTAAHIKADLKRRQVTRQVYCPKCRHINSARVPHCERCQTPLTPISPYPCQACGKSNRFGSQTCAACGDRIRFA